MRRTISILGVVVFVLALAQPAAATSGTMTITSDTTLTEDHDGNIVIDADDVTLDCAGFTVTGLPEQQGILVADRDDVTIRNCRVTNALNGIAIVGFAERTEVRGNTTFDNANAGIAADQAVYTRIIGNTTTGNADNGIQVIEAAGVLVKGNTASDNGGTGIATAEATDCVFRNNMLIGNAQSGIGLGSSSGSVLRDNTARGNDGAGFPLWRSDGNVLVANTARGNPSEGFFLGRSSVNVLRENRSVRNGANGFLIQASDNNILRSNVANGNHQGDFVEGAGFQTARSDGNLFVGNRAFANDDGFVLWVHSNDNAYVDNVACRNEDWDAYDNRTGEGNVWTANDFCTDNL